MQYIPVYIRELQHEIDSINEEAEKQKLPLPNYPKPPSWAYEFSPPSISVSMKTQAFTFIQGLIPGQKYTLGNKREYELTVSNESKTDARTLNFSLQFPVPWVVVASRIVGQAGTDNARFESPDRWAVSGTYSVQATGCYATGSYSLTASHIRGNGKVTVRFVLEKYNPSFTLPKTEQKLVPTDYIFGKFTYSHYGKPETGRYYAQLKSDGTNVTLMSQSATPDRLEMRTDMQFVPPPCIPSEAL